jgi:DNA-binding response OmpR family regulator
MPNKNKKVLLADESNTALMMGLLVLKKGAYDVIVARDGEEAVEKAVAEKPDLILLDAGLPRLDGRATADRLRAREDTRGIPVILLTSGGEEHDAPDTLAKPLDAFELLSKVRGHIGR